MKILNNLCNSLYILLIFYFKRRDYDVFSSKEETESGVVEYDYIDLPKGEIAEISKLVYEPKIHWTKKMIDMYVWQCKYSYTDKRVDNDWMFGNELSKLTGGRDAQFRFITNEQLRMIYPYKV